MALGDVEARLCALEASAGRVAKLEAELQSATRELSAVRRELQAVKLSRPTAPTVASAFALLAHEVASGPLAGLVVGRQLAAGLRRAEALLSCTWPAVQARGGAASLQVCWFGNAPSAGADPGGRTRKRAAVPAAACLLATLPQQLVLRVVCALDVKRGLGRLRAAARAFALPQLCFPGSQPLVAHARSLVRASLAEAQFRAAVPVEISGATGPNAPIINGVWERTRERRRGGWSTGSAATPAGGCPCRRTGGCCRPRRPRPPTTTARASRAARTWPRRWTCRERGGGSGPTARGSTRRACA